MSKNKQQLYLGDAWGLYRECTTLRTPSTTEYQPIALVGTLDQFSQGWQATMSELRESPTNQHHKTTAFRLFKYLGPDAPGGLAWCDEALYATQGHFGRYSVSLKTKDDVGPLWTDMALALVGSDYFGEFQSLIAGVAFFPEGGTFCRGAVQLIVKQAVANTEIATLFAEILDAPPKAAGFVSLSTARSKKSGILSPANTPLKGTKAAAPATPKSKPMKSSDLEASPAPSAPPSASNSKKPSTVTTPAANSPSKDETTEKVEKVAAKVEKIPAPQGEVKESRPAKQTKKQDRSESTTTNGKVGRNETPPPSAAEDSNVWSQKKLEQHTRDSYAVAKQLSEAGIAGIREVKAALTADAASKKKNSGSWFPTEFPEARGKGRFTPKGKARGLDDLLPSASFSYSTEWQTFQKANQITPKSLASVTAGTSSSGGGKTPEQFAVAGKQLEELIASWRSERDLMGYVAWALKQSLEIVQVLEGDTVPRGAITLEERHHRESMTGRWKAELQDLQQQQETVTSAAMSPTTSGKIGSIEEKVVSSGAPVKKDEPVVEKERAAVSPMAQEEAGEGCETEVSPAPSSVQSATPSEGSHSRAQRGGPKKKSGTASSGSSSVTTAHAAGAKGKSKQTKAPALPAGPSKKDLERQQRNLTVMVAFAFGSLFLGLVIATFYA